MALKKPTTFEEQLNLIEMRGCKVDDESLALDFLHRINYYRLTAYFLPFKNSNGTYKIGTTFTKITRIYDFDQKMRSLLFGVIEEIELMLRTRLSYHHAHEYGSLGYKDKDNFRERYNSNDLEKHIALAIKNNSKKPFVEHHVENYRGEFPIWVMVELFTMGELSRFYSNMKMADRKVIAKDVFSSYPKNVSSWLMCLTYLRNFCAHYVRLYYCNFPAIAVTPKGFEYKLGKKLFDYILVLKFLYPDNRKWNDKFCTHIEALVEEYADDINLEHIGFPEQWKELFRWKIKITK